MTAADEDDYAPEFRIDVVTVPPGTIARMRENPAVPSPELQAAIDRARIRRTGECPGGDACEC